MRIELPPLHPGQIAVRDSTARFKVLACGRRWGKSRLATALLIKRALEGGVAWVVVPVYAVGGPMFDELRKLAVQLPGAEVNRAERSIRFVHGGAVVVKTADDPALLRGAALDLVVFDEAGFMPRLQETWQEVVRPALADRRGAAMFCSTPNGQNYFWQLWQLGQDPDNADWQSWQMATGSNPFIDADEIVAARRHLSERQFAQEFLAEFVESGALFRNVRELATATAQTGPIAGHSYSMGIDWGRSGDYTVMTVFNVTLRQVVFVDRFTGLPYETQLGRVTAAIELWQPEVTVVELNSIGRPLFEQLERRELPGRLVGFTTTNSSKALLVDALALALEKREIALLNHPALIAELQAFQSETLPSGLTRYSAPAGSHDDCVMSLLLAFGPNADGAPAELRERGWVRGMA